MNNAVYTLVIESFGKKYLANRNDPWFIENLLLPKIVLYFKDFSLSLNEIKSIFQRLDNDLSSGKYLEFSDYMKQIYSSLKLPDEWWVNNFTKSDTIGLFMSDNFRCIAYSNYGKWYDLLVNTNNLDFLLYCLKKYNVEYDFSEKQGFLVYNREQLCSRVPFRYETIARGYFNLRRKYPVVGYLTNSRKGMIGLYYNKRMYSPVIVDLFSGEMAQFTTSSVSFDYNSEIIVPDNVYKKYLSEIWQADPNIITSFKWV